MHEKKHTPQETSPLLDQTGVRKWLLARTAKQVLIQQRGTVFQIKGICRGFAHLDACGASIERCFLHTADEAFDVSLSCHPGALGVHVICPSAELSLPLSIPYASLILEDALRT